MTSRLRVGPNVRYTIHCKGVVDHPRSLALDQAFGGGNLSHHLGPDGNSIVETHAGACDHAHIIDICYQLISDLGFDIVVAETIASHAPSVPTP
jgi:hypothetical protein